MKKYKIVLVENDEDEQMFMREAFEASEHFELIGQARNGDMLFQWMSEHPDALPEVILSDLNMPGKNGYDIIEEVGAHPVYSSIPVIITSTSSTEMIIRKCLDMGATAYIIKPETFLDYGPFTERLFELVQEKEKTAG